MTEQFEAKHGLMESTAIFGLFDWQNRQAHRLLSVGHEEPLTLVAIPLPSAV